MAQTAKIQTKKANKKEGKERSITYMSENRKYILNFGLMPYYNSCVSFKKPTYQYALEQAFKAKNVKQMELLTHSWKTTRKWRADLDGAMMRDMLTYGRLHGATDCSGFCVLGIIPLECERLTKAQHLQRSEQLNLKEDMSDADFAKALSKKFFFIPETLSQVQEILKAVIGIFPLLSGHHVCLASLVYAKGLISSRNTTITSFGKSQAIHYFCSSSYMGWRYKKTIFSKMQKKS